jgi:hypothetical protein
LFLARLRAASAAGELRFSGALAALAEPDGFAARLEALRGIDWVVYAKPPFAGPEPVLAYLGRYTHRVAIANSRLTRLAEGHVDFTWKDYRHHGKTKTMTLVRQAARLQGGQTRQVIPAALQEAVRLAGMCTGRSRARYQGSMARHAVRWCATAAGPRQCGPLAHRQQHSPFAVGHRTPRRLHPTLSHRA